MHSVAVAFSASLLILLARYIAIWRQRRGLPLPPGPRGFPIVGNIQDVKKRADQPRWKTYVEWSHQYRSDVVYLEVLKDPMVILNSHKAVTEVLEKRSKNYSDRPSMHMANDLMNMDWDLVHMRYTDWWRLHRKTFHQFFQQRAVPEFEAIQKSAAASLVQKLSTSPDDYYRHVKHFAGYIILKLVYGYNLQADNDPYVELAKNAMEGVSASVNHGSFLVDFIPLLKYVPSWFPGAEFKRKAELWEPRVSAVKDQPWEWLKKSINDGTAESSFCSQNLDKFMNEESMEEVIKNCAGIAYLAGSDTTASVVLTFILAMVLHPEIQARAHAEIDSVIGPSRLPTYEDRENLPFIEAVYAEVLRWQPAVPLALPHRSLNDDIYEGHFIPGGATVVGNVWGVLHDETLYPDPEAFNPDRFIKKGNEELPPHPEEIAFGFGRRVCPGRHLAVNSVWIAMAYLLSTYRLVKAVDSDGKEVEPIIEYNDGVVSHPHEFACRFIPRNEKLVQQAATIAH